MPRYQVASQISSEETHLPIPIYPPALLDVNRAGSQRLIPVCNYRKNLLTGVFTRPRQENCCLTSWLAIKDCYALAVEYMRTKLTPLEKEAVGELID